MNAMDAAAILKIPDYTLDFHVNVVEKEGMVKAIVFQKIHGERRPLKYLSWLPSAKETQDAKNTCWLCRHSWRATTLHSQTGKTTKWYQHSNIQTSHFPVKVWPQTSNTCKMVITAKSNIERRTKRCPAYLITAKSWTHLLHRWLLLKDSYRGKRWVLCCHGNDRQQICYCGSRNPSSTRVSVTGENSGANTPSWASARENGEHHHRLWLGPHNSHADNPMWVRGN